MKHELKITFLLITTFILAQLVGLNIISQYINVKESYHTETTVINSDLYIISPPEVENESNSWIFILISILFGTLIILLMAKYKLFSFWKYWFSLSVFLTLFIALVPYIKKISKFIGLTNYYLWITFFLVTYLSYYKVMKQNIWIHNITEIFIYGGIAALFVPIIDITSGIILLVLIAFYDAYAVWKSKHMVTMANFQTDSMLFAGINIPYSHEKHEIAKKTARKKISDSKNKKLKDTFKTKNIPKPIKYKSNKKEEVSNSAILGGGDIAFPLLFAGAVIKSTGNLYDGFLIIAGATSALIVLLTMSKKNRFYPAMPFISTGCLIAYFVIVKLL